MKRRKENFTDRNRADKHIFRKRSLDDTRQFEGIDPDDYQEDSPDEEMHFDFDESDVEKFRHQNLDDGPDGRTRTGYRSADSRTRVNVKPDRAYRKQDIDENEDTRSPRGGGDTVFFGIANKKKTNSEIRRLSYVMLALIFGVAVYMVYFKIAGSRNVVNNPNNALLSKLEEKVVRGSILSADGEILAKSSQADDGSYYRYYPYSSAFAHVVGTSAVNKSGVEQAADYDLVTSNISPAQKVLNDRI